MYRNHHFIFSTRIRNTHFVTYCVFGRRLSILFGLSHLSCRFFFSADRYLFIGILDWIFHFFVPLLFHSLISSESFLLLSVRWSITILSFDQEFEFPKFNFRNRLLVNSSLPNRWDFSIFCISETFHCFPIVEHKVFFPSCRFRRWKKAPLI